MRAATHLYKGKFVGLGLLASAVFLTGSVLASHNVSRNVTAQDVKAARQLLPGPHVKPTTFDDQIAVIAAIQNKVLGVAPVNDGIPENHSRELADLIRAGHGLCFDRSRAIETMLRTYGFDTRHVAVYSTARTGSSWKSLSSPGVDSHALTEVRTRRGWMLVGSNSRWFGLTSRGEVVGARQLQQRFDRKWSALVKEPAPSILEKPYVFLYGLYSRHGRFYPPYDRIPDINWSEFIQNV